MNPTKTTLRLMASRHLSRCQVLGCNNDAEEAHHMLHGKKKGIHELNQDENLALVCRECHHITGKAKSWDAKVNYWKWACSHYGREHMIEWYKSIPLKIKEKAYK